MKNKLPQTDALQTGLLSVYVASLKPEAEQSRQGAPPDAMLSLLYCNGSQRTLIPLNFDATDPQHIQLSTRENGRLAVTLDSHRHMYLLYAPVLNFATPSWDSTLPSLEHLYVWWLDPLKKTVRRLLLPQGPWVRDAKLDGVYLRGERNFSCGTECYRAYDVDVDSGTIFITITGQASAVSKTY